MEALTVVGVDIGGTKINIGKVTQGKIIKEYSCITSANSSKDKIINEVIQGIEEVYDQNISGIGVGVPGLVDKNEGIVHSILNIPSWNEVHLKTILENHFKKKVYIDNDANCYAVGEKIFGKGKEIKNFVGITLGTGFGAGIIINNKVYSGIKCGAGEFGSIPYLDQDYEYYCSGKFFINKFGQDGCEVYKKIRQGDQEAIRIFNEFGEHLGNAIKTILYAIAPEAVFLGGSISKAFPFFKESMWNSVKKFPYRNIYQNLIIDASEQSNIGMLGAAALFYIKMKNSE